MENNIELKKAVTEPLKLYELEKSCCKASVLRLDKIHPVISGNKWFKLKYHLEAARKGNFDTILTFGGAYSNHIAATALAVKQAGLKAIGIIRGERPAKLSHTLQEALKNGMELHFVSRETYRSKSTEDFENVYIVPEGGGGDAGIKGSREILELTDYHKYSHIICAIGTGTTYLGIVNKSVIEQEIIGIPVLKGMDSLLLQLENKIENPDKLQYCRIMPDYHFGGYARKTQELLEFMNSFYEQTGIPTDFVYTGKLMYAFMDLLKKGYFSSGSNILLIHSGGLQGNKSLPEGSLIF